MRSDCHCKKVLFEEWKIIDLYGAHTIRAKFSVEMIEDVIVRSRSYAIKGGGLGEQPDVVQFFHKAAKEAFADEVRMSYGGDNIEFRSAHCSTAVDGTVIRAAIVEADQWYKRLTEITMLVAEQLIGERPQAPLGMVGRFPAAQVGGRELGERWSLDLVDDDLSRRRARRVRVRHGDDHSLAPLVEDHGFLSAPK